MDKGTLSYNYKEYYFPKDWIQFKIGDLLKIVERPVDMIDDKGYNLITVKRNFAGIESRGILSGEQILVKSQFEIHEGDFVISKRQIAHGACAIVPNQFGGAIVSNEYNVMKSTDKLYLPFFNYYAQLPYMKRYFYITSDGVHIEKLLFKTKDWLRQIITIPTLEEQKKIAEILLTYDKTIELKTKLINHKKDFKKTLMDRLLNGKIVLSGFEGKWVEIRLGEVLIERNETGYGNLQLLAITSSKGVVKRTEVDVKDNSSEDKSRYKRIMPLDIGYNTMRMWQGVSGVSEYEGIVSPAYTILKPTEKVDSYFMTYLFKLPKVIDLFRRYSQGLVDDTLNLKYSNFKVIKLSIPKDINEQKGIAKILLLQDKELELLEKELELLKEEKKGLMQLLLTGRVRV